MPVEVTIDGRTFQAESGQTILDVARANGIAIPTICFHEATTPYALCRICVVDVEGWRLPQPACVVQVQDGMQVHTRSPRIDRIRRTILEMLAATVDLSEAPAIQAMMQEYAADPEGFPQARPRRVPLIDDNPMFVRDYSKCLLCWRCVQVCAEDAQYTYAINFTGRGYFTQIGTFYGLPLPQTTCVFCGQCIGVCPTGALKAKTEHLLEQGLTPEAIIALHMEEKRRRRRVELPPFIQEENGREP